MLQDHSYCKSGVYVVESVFLFYKNSLYKKLKFPFTISSVIVTKGTVSAEFPQNFHTKKLCEITVFYAVVHERISSIFNEKI